MPDILIHPPAKASDLLAIGAVTLRRSEPVQTLSVAPFRGRVDDVARVLTAAFDLDALQTGKHTQAGAVRLVWMGRDLWFLEGADPETVRDALQDLAQVTDQTDGWTCLTIEGDDAADVLARLCPLDLHPSEFPSGTSARSLIGHVHAGMAAVEHGFEIRVPRSLCESVSEDIETAMRSVRSQKDLQGK